MGVTIVLRLRAQDGHHQEIVATTVRDFEAACAGSPGCRHARFFQALGTPEEFFYVAEWDNRELFEHGGGPLRAPALDSAMVGLDGPFVCRELYSCENMARRAEVVAVAVSEAPPASAVAVRDLATELGRAAGQTSGLVLYRLAEDVDHPGRLVLLYGWESMAALELARGSASLALHGRLRELGARITVSVGRPRAAFDRPVIP